MSVKVGAGLSAEHDPLEAGQAAASAALSGLSGAPADLAVVFATGAHLAAPEAALEAVSAVLDPRALLGCGAGGVLGGGRELESGTALAVWAAALGDGGRAVPFHARVSAAGLKPELEGLPRAGAGSGVIVLSDPHSFATDALLDALAGDAPQIPVLGGIASARTPEGEGALFLDEEVVTDGAVGVLLEGIDIRPCVSQGAAPLGREVTITSGEGNVIHELAGRPALEMVEHLIAELAPRERQLVAAGLLIGIVIDSGKPEYGQGDFLVRGVLGANPQSGSLVVGTTIHPGQVVRLHARDARSADADLRRALRHQVEALGERRPAGALVFSCNGRGRAMFGETDHDAAVVQSELAGAPAAGFFAAGEIGPVGSRSYLHGFTATVALFPG